MMRSHAELGGNVKQVRVLVRAFSLLEVIARSPAGISLRDLSRHVGLHKSTALRMLQTMATLGYVAQTGEAKLYRIGDRLPASRRDIPASSARDLQIRGG